MTEARILPNHIDRVLYRELHAAGAPRAPFIEGVEDFSEIV
jgi:hypothetical protein